MSEKNIKNSEKIIEGFMPFDLGIFEWCSFCSTNHYFQAFYFCIFFYAMFLALNGNGGWDIISPIFACCCPIIYVIYYHVTQFNSYYYD